MKTLRKTCAMLCGLMLCTVAYAGSMNNKTVAEIAASNKNFTTLVTALKKAELVDALKGEGPFTVFAPTNDAFAKLPEGTLEKLLDDPKKLKAVLLYHVVSGDIKSKMIEPSELKTLEGRPVALTLKGGKLYVNSAMVTAVDIDGKNGVIHVIDKVLIPPKE